jgi:uncharacterized membrane protein
MNRLLEIILGLDKGFLSKEGEFSLSFNPGWPGQSVVGAGLWNFVLIAGAIALIIYVYKREGRSRNVRIALGIIRGLVLGLLIALLNRPVLTLGQSRTEPSVLAVLVDDSISMRVRDASLHDSDGTPIGRLEAATQLLTDDDQKLIRDLSKVHQLHFYRFDSSATPITGSSAASTSQPSQTPEQVAIAQAEQLKQVQPAGQNTQVGKSIRAVLDDLQGQRLAGIVLLTDGRDTPAQSLASTLSMVSDAGAKIYPIVVGSDKAPTNIAIQSVSAQESAFKGDIVNVRVAVRGTGFPSSQKVAVQLKDKKTGLPIRDPAGKPVEEVIEINDDSPVEAELLFKANEVGQLDLVVEAAKQPGEIDDEDNSRELQIAVLDAKINVLYVDGYPRWEYRYIKNEMIRDQTVDISLLLTSADPSFRQDGDRPITRFPITLDELLDYDVVLFGDVDARQFSDAQLQLVSDFVNKRGGGFGMIAGPRWSPLAYKGTPIEALLPVNISKVQPDDGQPIVTGFRPSLTKDGATSSIFRFYPDRAANEKFMREGIQPIFWYLKGITAKPGVGEVYAEHPMETGPDGRKAPILVVGRYGAGRTLFSAIDDSWRWRYYTGEPVFDTYWIQQLRYLARSKKLGQRRVSLASVRPVYELGEQVHVQMRVLDPQLLQQLPEQLRVDIMDATGRVIRQESLIRQEGEPDLYNLSYAADQIGKFVVRLGAVVGGSDAMEVPLEVSVPRLELATPEIDRTTLMRIASETHGQMVDLTKAKEVLPTLIPSAAKIIPLESSQPLWDAPIAMLLFVFLITAEWLLRKLYGML